jgi:hypothetical protein
VFTTISGVEFDNCHRRRVSGIIDGVSVQLIDVADLIRNKKASGRHKDLGDVEHLEKARVKRLRRKPTVTKKSKQKRQ